MIRNLCSGVCCLQPDQYRWRRPRGEVRASLALPWRTPQSTRSCGEALTVDRRRQCRQSYMSSSGAHAQMLLLARGSLRCISPSTSSSARPRSGGS